MKYRSIYLAFAVFLAAAQCGAHGQQPDHQPLPADLRLDSSMATMDTQGSVYVPLDYWIYPALY